MARKNVFGVPIGYTHDWAYKGHWREKKIGPGRWRIKFTATKGKKSGKGGPVAGSKILWGFRNVKQRAVKTGAGRYQTVLTGEKYTIKSQMKSKRKYRRR